jgi:dipeptidyl aminopeptidase/acylaminoacyl peptidase
VAAMAALPQSAGAVLSGVNGRIVFATGRGQANDTTAKLYLRTAFGSVGAGSASLITTATGAGQHRHPTWSPDRTRIAYAEGPTTGANFDIFILDLTNPNATPQNITNSNNVTDDRPAWSPDGTRIAFESENADGGAIPNQLNLKIYTVATGATANFSSTTVGTYEHKPAWTPDSQTLFYVLGDPNTANAMSIVSEPAGGGTVSPICCAGAPSEFQPSISPDGTHMCFTRGTQQGSSDSRVWWAFSNGGGSVELPGTNGVASYNCTWSPDGKLISYVRGTFADGNLFIEDSNPQPPDFSLGIEEVANRFDGNPDWAPDGRPSCEDRTVITTSGQPVAVPVSCPDTGPAYEQTQVSGIVDTKPVNGTVSPSPPDDPAVPLPANFTYTPKAGFLGTDSFTVLSFDEVSFGVRLGTLTIRVTTPCAGKTPTILGTDAKDQLTGTGAADVIDGLGGKDTVKALGGNDTVCGGPGKDTLKGGGGKDKLLGQQGNDALKGGGGKDTCKGAQGRDTASACEVQKSI